MSTEEPVALDQEQPADAASPEDELLDDQADAAEDFINGLLDVLDMDGEAEAEFEDDLILLDVSGPDMGLLIGRHGATLEALQELTRAAVQHQTAARVRLNLDIDGYRERERDILERKARSAAARVRKSGKLVQMDPMSSYERKVVHDALTNFDGVTTFSEGTEPDRYVVIKPA